MRASLVKLPGLGELESRWRELECRATPSLFTSWDWIGCWLGTLPPSARPALVSVEEGGRTVGLGTIGRSTVRHSRLIGARAIHLNVTGNPDYDSVAIEYNGFLVERGLERSVLRCCAQLLLEYQDWDEWGFPGMADRDILESFKFSELGPTIEAHKPSYYVDLKALREAGIHYRDALSRNTRYQVRRTSSEFEKLGKLTLDVAGTLDEAQSFLGELQKLHQARWTARELPGAFASRYFSEFHHRFIRNGFSNGIVQLMRVRAGTRTLGCLYNFVYRGRVLFYQSGFDYSLETRHNSPGLVTHVMAIDFNFALGHDVYDFLAGQARYKQQLSTHSFDMYWISVRRDRLKYRIADWLRVEKHRLERVRTIVGGRLGKLLASTFAREREQAAIEDPNRSIADRQKSGKQRLHLDDPP